MVAGCFLCGETEFVLFYRCQYARITLNTSCVVVANILLVHLSEIMIAGEPSAVIAFLFQNSLEALQRAVINAICNTGHALRHLCIKLTV